MSRSRPLIEPSNESLGFPRRGSAARPDGCNVRMSSVRQWSPKNTSHHLTAAELPLHYATTLGYDRRQRPSRCLLHGTAQLSRMPRCNGVSLGIKWEMRPLSKQSCNSSNWLTARTSDSARVPRLHHSQPGIEFMSASRADEQAVTSVCSARVS